VDILHECFVRFSFEALGAGGATLMDFGIVGDGRLRLIAGSSIPPKPDNGRRESKRGPT